MDLALLASVPSYDYEDFVVFLDLHTNPSL
jgi:hypothetical protein